jgi:hypothetical protein
VSRGDTCLHEIHSKNNKGAIMKKGLGMLAVAAMVLSLAEGAAAASARCTVVEVRGDQLIIDCGERSSHFPPKSSIKIKSAGKNAIEGC